MTKNPIAAAPFAAVELIGELERGGAITSNQAKRLLEGWYELEDEWWSSPYLRTVREHSCAWIDAVRRSTAPEAAR
jgi:hypothetical protein